MLSGVFVLQPEYAKKNNKILIQREHLTLLKCGNVWNDENYSWCGSSGIALVKC